MQYRNVLVVEDEPCVASLLVDVFRGCEATVSTTPNGLAAVNTLKTNRFDLIFLDISAFDRQGWLVLEYLRRHRPDLWPRTVITTADRFHTKTVMRIHKLQRPVVYKPFALAQLRATARDVLLTADYNDAAKTSAA